MLPTEDAALGGRGAGTAVRLAVLADRDDGDRRQPLCAAGRTGSRAGRRYSFSTAAITSVDETLATCDGGPVAAGRGLLGRSPDPRTRRGRGIQRHARRWKQRSRKGCRARDHRPVLTNPRIVLPIRDFMTHCALSRDTGTLLLDGRDAHDLDRPRWLHGPMGSIRTCSCWANPSREACRRRPTGSPTSWPTGSPHRSSSSDVDVGGIGGTLAGERALARGDARDARRGAHRRGVRAHDPARASAGRRASRTRSPSTSLPWHVTRLGCRAEYLFGRDRPRNGSEAHAAGRRRARALHAPLRAQPRDPAHPVPRHGADVACDGGVRRRPPHEGLSGGGGGAHALTKRTQFANIARDGRLRRMNGRH